MKMILCIQCARSVVEGSCAFGQGLSSFFCGEQKRFNFKPAAIETMKELMGVGAFNDSFNGHPRTDSRNNAQGRETSLAVPHMQQF